MTGKAQDAEFRHPEAVAQLPRLTDEEAAKHLALESACKQIAGSRFKRAGCHWSKAGANTLLAVKCCLENRRSTDFLDWRACQVAAA